MENKMTNEMERKINDLRGEIQELQKQISKKEAEIHRILTEMSVDFENDYVEFYNGDEYVFMKVENQIIRDAGSTIILKGPAIRLDDSPLREHFVDYNEIGMAYYNSYDSLMFTPEVLEERTIDRIRKITKDDMAFVLDNYINTIKKNLL